MITADGTHHKCQLNVFKFLCRVDNEPKVCSNDMLNVSVKHA